MVIYNFRYFIVLLLSVFTLSVNIYAGCPVPGMTLFECLKFQIENHRLPKEGDQIFNPISYCEFDLFKKSGEVTALEADNLITYAYRAGNPTLFRAPQEAISPDLYSLNFLWIHKDARSSGRGHFMGEKDELLESEIINPILEWQSKQPKAKINYWYDGKFIEKQQLEITADLLAKKNVILENVLFRDIRSIPLVADNPDLFDEKVAIYFRVDVAKALIGYHVLNETKYAVNVDTDVAAIVNEQLFDEKTIFDLENFGFVMGAANLANKENSFIMLNRDFKNRERKSTQQILFEKVIQPSLAGGGAGSESFLSNMVFQKYAEIPDSMEKAMLRDSLRYVKMLKFLKIEEDDNGDYIDLITSLPLQHVKDRGKLLIFPDSKQGSKGYSREQIIKLKKTLVGIEGCR